MIQLNPAPLDSSDSLDSNNDNNIYKNKTLKNKKQVKFNDCNSDNINRDNFNYEYHSINKPTFNNDTNKKIKNLNSLISKLHNKNEDDNEETDYANYKDIYKPTKTFLDNTKIYDDKSYKNNYNGEITDMSELKNINNKNILNNSNDIDLDLMNYNKNYNEQNYNNNNKEYQKYIDINNKILTKLDNILNLLENQKSEKTNHLTEELILYVFLGLFIIYVLESFTRMGKYVR
tara:strand:+ start:2605 stop:3300 length:696 start_codon:yes stop_codon:yes gene_type:complete